jgi:hypothetical protein
MWYLVLPCLDGIRKRYLLCHSDATLYLIPALLPFLVYSFGSAEYGQLGNGRTGEHIATGNKSAFDIESDPS